MESEPSQKAFPIREVPWDDFSDRDTNLADAPEPDQVPKHSLFRLLDARGYHSFTGFQ